MDLRMLFALLVGLHSGFTFLSIPPALDRLMVLYGVSYTGISVLISALMWSHAAMQIPAGLIADRLGVRRTLSAGLIFIAVGNFLAAAMPSVEMALVGRVVTGIGTGLTFVTVLKLIALHAPQGRVGAFQAFSGGAFSIGSIMAYLIFPRIVGFGWQWIYLVPGLGSLPLLVMLLRLSIAPAPDAAPTIASFGRIFRMSSGWIIGLMHALSWGTVISFGNWMPSLLAEAWDSSPAIRFAWGGALSMLVSGLGRWMGGFFLLRLPPVPVARGSVLILAVIFAGLFLIPGPLFIFSLALTATWFASVNFGALFHLASRAAPVDSQATLFGFVNFLANLGAILFTLVFGWIKDTHGSFRWGFAVLAVWSLVSFAVSRFIRKEP